MPDETQQPTPEQTQPESISTHSVENPISEPNPIPETPSEPMAEVPVQQADSALVDVPPVATEASTSTEDPVPLKEDNPANEPLEKPTKTVPTEQETQKIEPNQEQNPALKTPQNPPETPSEKPTAHLPPIEPLGETQNEQRKENLKLANKKRQSKKREKINEILNLFSENKGTTNDEVEKLLHVSDATATRYLETLEKEGKIKQVGKTGKYTNYEKI